MSNPYNGHPTGELYGKKSNIKSVLKSIPGWGMDENDAEYYIQDHSYKHATGGKI